MKYLATNRKKAKYIIFLFETVKEKIARTLVCHKKKVAPRGERPDQTSQR